MFVATSEIFSTVTPKVVIDLNGNPRKKFSQKPAADKPSKSKLYSKAQSTEDIDF